jgi:hypothetical protein
MNQLFPQGAGSLGAIQMPRGTCSLRS